MLGNLPNGELPNEYGFAAGKRMNEKGYFGLFGFHQNSNDIAYAQGLTEIGAFYVRQMLKNDNWQLKLGGSMFYQDSFWDLKQYDDVRYAIIPIARTMLGRRESDQVILGALGLTLTYKKWTLDHSYSYFQIARLKSQDYDLNNSKSFSKLSYQFEIGAKKHLKIVPYFLLEASGYKHFGEEYYGLQIAYKRLFSEFCFEGFDSYDNNSGRVGFHTNRVTFWLATSNYNTYVPSSWSMNYYTNKTKFVHQLGLSVKVGK